MTRLGLVSFGFMLAMSVQAQQTSVVDSVHNLSATGPGSVRATSEEQVCIFCHAPHNASPVRPLWNRQMPTDSYLIYSSRSFDAEPGQPTGMSKMCLSCHDGTIAIGNVVSRETPISMSSGVTTIPAGSAHIGTDLRDDHPVSFRYDHSLASLDQQLLDPMTIPHEIQLDANGEMQCTSCHDAHNNAFGNFLVMSNIGAQLCMSCHQVGTTPIMDHQDCASCHQPHSAPSGPYLLRGSTIAETCLMCHDGSDPDAQDIATDVAKFSTHETHSVVDPAGSAFEHVSCVDCHQPHTMQIGSGIAPSVHPNFGEVDGVSASGAEIQSASFEYEVCFKCHADSTSISPIVGRTIVESNTREEFATDAVSYHPVVGPGRNADVQSLLPQWSESSVMYCSDCHGSDNSELTGGLGSPGVHGSSESPLLVARYSMNDLTTESSQAYALCYRCHDRNSILGDESFPEHRKHIVEEDTSCYVCHDAHGISSIQGSSRNNSHLINFATGVVLPDPISGRLEFIDQGLLAGTCYMQCHGTVHSPETYINR
ncbi:MAG: cytochrome c3 family protein [Planctomycetota bacterium]|jgi:predicted CXXCH cytochrome family protein